MRFISLFVLACLVSPCVSAAAATPEDFAKAVTTKGAEYEQAREKLLQQDADEAFIKSKLQSDSPQEKLTAKIILGWREHKDEYAALLAQSFFDQKGEKRFTWSYDPEAIKPEFLPLMYELLLKDVGSVGARDAAVRVINYLARQGTHPDVKELVALLKQNETSEPTRAAVARTVSSLPQALIKPDELLSLLEAETNRDARSKDVAGNLMNGLIRLGGKLPEAHKDELVGRMLGMERLHALVGETPVVHTVGGIGGNTSASLVSEFLDQTQSATEKRWALGSLATMSNDRALDSLLRYAQSSDSNPQLRVYAIESLSKSKYSSRVGKALEDIINNTDKTIRDRMEAIKSLDKLHQFNIRDDSTESDIRSRFERINTGNIDNPQLKSQIQSLQQGVERRALRP